MSVNRGGRPVREREPGGRAGSDDLFRFGQIETSAVPFCSSVIYIMNSPLRASLVFYVGVEMFKVSVLCRRANEDEQACAASLPSLFVRV